MFLYITILLIIAFLSFYINVFVIEKKCPESQVIYKYLPEDTFSDQFRENKDRVGYMFK